jgi:hypothetical protein
MDLKVVALYWPEIGTAAFFVFAWVAVGALLIRPWARDAGRAPSDRRFCSRVRSKFKACLDFDGRRFRARGVNFDRFGALVKLKRELTPGSRVFLYLKSERLMGWATVRHCSRKGPLTYRVGMQFRGPLMRVEAGHWEFQRVAEK